MGSEAVKAEVVSPGWIGRPDHVEYYLDIIGADKDEEGRFMIYGAPPCVGLGGQDMVISGVCEYSKNGHRANLAAALNSTSYGLKVMVF